MTLIGQRVGHYRVQALLGRGGMGEVYVGFDETLERRVALKTIRAEHRLRAHSQARFLREARILSNLDHPSICRVYDYLEGDEQDVLVLELIEGEPLGKAIERGFDHARAMEIAEQIARALVEAHGVGVVHRDLKPDNVMLTPTGEVKVLDFGLARTESHEPLQNGARSEVAIPDVESAMETVPEGESAMETVDGATTYTRTSAPTEFLSPAALTEAGAITGTPMYMSPEQASGEPVASSSDMYSYGLLLQHLFTGDYPYDPAQSPTEFLERIRRADTRPVHGLDKHLTQLIERLKAQAPGARPTATEAFERLRWIRGKPRRRLRNLTIAAGILLVLAGSLKYTLDLRRARDIADQRRVQAEGLIEFMLGDLRAKLEPVGRLEVLDDVGRKALEYFGSVPEKELSERELFRRSQALGQIGQVRVSQGDLSGGLEAFRQSLAQAREMAARDPDNQERQVGLGASLFWVGYVAWRRGELDTALEHFEEYRAVSERLVERYPDDPAMRLELGYAYSNLGSVLEAKGDLRGALERYRACLEIERELSANDPDDSELQLSLAASHNAVGKMLADLGEPEAALESYLADLAIKERLVGSDPANTTWRAALSVTHNLIGGLLFSMGDVAEAIRHFREATSIMLALSELDASNAKWQRELAVNLMGAGNSSRALGLLEESAASLAKAFGMLTELSDRDPSDPVLKMDRFWALTRWSRTLIASDRLDPAEQRAAAALVILEDLSDEVSADARILRMESEVHDLLGRVWSRRGDAERASQEWTLALSAVETAISQSSDRRLLVHLARLLLQLDRLAEARPIVLQMTTAGYRDSDLMDLCEERGLEVPHDSGRRVRVTPTQ